MQEGLSRKHSELAGWAGTCHATESGLFSNSLENCSSRIEQPAGNFWKVTLRDSDWLLPQFPPFAKHEMTESPSPCIAWMSYTVSIMWLPTFICFIGSRVKTLIYFYGTHGLGDFFIIKNEILEKNSKVWFHSFLQY